MLDAPMKEIKLFYCYAREDKTFRDQIEKQLSILKRQFHLTTWHDREILPGTNWKQAIDEHLSTAHLILLLISPDFMASDYCYGKEMAKALEREKTKTCRVIPILLRPSDWKEAPFSHLQMLPSDARPITAWPGLDEAFQDVAIGIRQSLKDLSLMLKTEKEWLKEGKSLYSHQRYHEALAIYEQALRYNPNSVDIYNQMGEALWSLHQYEESLAAYEQAIHLNPSSDYAYYGKGWLLNNLKQYEKSLVAYEQALQLNPYFADVYYGKGNTLSNLGRYEEALMAYEKALSLDFNPNFAYIYYKKGNALYGLNRYEEALADYEHALSLDANFALAYYRKGSSLQMIGRNKEAQLAFEEARKLGYKD